MTDLVLSVSEFVAVLNQSLEYAYPKITLVGEIANFRVSKNRWVYFDLKDDEASVRCFGTVYQLPGPLQDGMLLEVSGSPRLHAQYGFSLNVLRLKPTGEGSIKKAAGLLEAQLAKEGLFDASRKRHLPYPPTHIGLITSRESAAYHDFMKVLSARWGGVQISFVDVQVQGMAASGQVVRAIDQLNQLPESPEVLVIIRGGGSADDLQAFGTEQVTRAVATSRIATLVAIGHEVDLCLAELAADLRASTPSNAAELLVPDRREVLRNVRSQRANLARLVHDQLQSTHLKVTASRQELNAVVDRIVAHASQTLTLKKQLLSAFDPQTALSRGYAIVRDHNQLVTSGKGVQPGGELTVQLSDAHLATIVKSVTMEQKGL